MQILKVVDGMLGQNILLADREMSDGKAGVRDGEAGVRRWVQYGQYCEGMDLGKDVSIAESHEEAEAASRKMEVHDRADRF